MTDETSANAGADDDDAAALAALEEAYEAALAHEKAGRIDDAVAGWRAVLALDPADHGGAAIRLAALGRGPIPEAASPDYVATLFDQHAEVFDGMLVDQLGYDVPLQLAEMLRPKLAAPVGRLLDLGCGTGLAGEALEAMAEHLTGVDLAQGMIEVADEKGVYHELFVGDAVGFLEAPETADAAPFDLIVATDMLPYLGEIRPLLRAAAARLAPGGRLALSSETLPDATMAGRGYIVGPKQRFAHSRAELETAVAETGLALEELQPITVRYDDGAATPGYLLIARAVG